MTSRVPQRFRADIVRKIGHGGEATVYELQGGRALRVFHQAPHDGGRLMAFYRSISHGTASFALPEVIEQGEDDGVFFSLDRLIEGRPLHELMLTLGGDDRRRALTSYIDAATEIAALTLPEERFGEFLRDDDSIQAQTWSAYLLARMQRSLMAAPWLPADVPGLDALVAALAIRLRALTPSRPSLVHGDYFPGNVLMSDALTVAGVIDFGPLTVIGDPALDLTSAVMFLEVARPGYVPADTELALARIIMHAGREIAEALATYRAWYAIRFAPHREDDANLYAWCVASLRQVRDELGS